MFEMYFYFKMWYYEISNWPYKNTTHTHTHHHLHFPSPPEIIAHKNSARTKLTKIHFHTFLKVHKTYETNSPYFCEVKYFSVCSVSPVKQMKYAIQKRVLFVCIHHLQLPFDRSIRYRYGLPTSELCHTTTFYTSGL